MSINFHSRLDEEQLSSLTQRLTPWQTWIIQSMWVTDSRMLCSLHRSCLVYPLIVLTVKVFFVKNRASSKWKDIISGFPVSPGSTEALVRWGGKIKYTVCFGCLLSRQHVAKNCCNRTVYVKIIASQRCDVFSDTVYIQHVRRIGLIDNTHAMRQRLYTTSEMLDFHSVVGPCRFSWNMNKLAVTNLMVGLYKIVRRTIEISGKCDRTKYCQN